MSVQVPKTITPNVTAKTNVLDPKNCNECSYVADCIHAFRYCPYDGRVRSLDPITIPRLVEF